MWKWLLGNFARRREQRRQHRESILREMGGPPPRHLMHVSAAPESRRPTSTPDFRESQSVHEGILARRHFSR
jgi:hypothetical protein